MNKNILASTLIDTNQSLQKKGVNQMPRLTEEQKAVISNEFGINIGADATARENGLVVKYLVDKALQQR